MRNLPVLLMFLLFSLPSFSGDKVLAQYNYSLYGVGVGQQKVSFLSPLFYTGYSYVSANGKVKETSNRVTQFETNINLAANSNHNNSNFYSAGFGLCYNKYYLFPLKDCPNSFPYFFAGWGYWLDAAIDYKPTNTNNPTCYNFNNMACVSVLCEKKFQNLRLSYQLKIPVLGIYSGSEYGSGLPYFLSEEGGNFFSAFDIGSVGMNPQMLNRFNADFKLKAKGGVRTLRVEYEISSTKLKLNNNVKHNTFHIFKVGYLFNKSGYEHK